jgi:hypothetical protein
MTTESTKYQTTEYNRSERVLCTLREVYSFARHFHQTHQQLRDECKRRIYDTPDYAKLTPYYRGVFDGTRRALGDALYQRDLEWRLYLDGVLVRSEDVPDGRWCDTRGGEHVWREAPDKLFSTAATSTVDARVKP